MTGLLKLRLRARALSATYFAPNLGGATVLTGGRFTDKSAAVLRKAARIRSKEKKT